MSAKLLCVVRDRLADAIGPVMLFPAVPAAIRSFSDLALDPATLVHRHPADFDLLQVGVIDEGSGELTPFCPPLVLVTGEAWAASQASSSSSSSEAQLSLVKEA